MTPDTGMMPAAAAAAVNQASLRLVAVVVTYNRLDKLKATVARLLESPAHELAALVVVDNASSDGTGAWLAGLQEPRLDVLRSAQNLGGAGGFESGMRRAMEAHAPDWLVVMDDDGRPESGGLAAFHALPTHRAPAQAWDGVAAAVYFPQGGICEMNRPSRNPFWHRREFLRTLFGGAAEPSLCTRALAMRSPLPAFHSANAERALVFGKKANPCKR